MQIGGLRMQNAYFGNAGTQGGTRNTAVNPIMALKEETASSKVRERDTFSLTPAADNVNSFDQLVTLVEKGRNTTAYQNVSLEVSGDNKKMVIGGGSSGRTIHVGLSNGWVLEFDRDADISGMLDLFSPEEELDDAKGSVGELLNQDVSGAEVKDKNTQETKATANSKEAEKEEEESGTSSQIIVNADGSRQLVITTKVGDTEMLTKIELTPAKSSDKLKAEQSLFKEEPFDEKIRPIDNQIRNALNAYEANFMYA